MISIDTVNSPILFASFAKGNLAGARARAQQKGAWALWERPNGLGQKGQNRFSQIQLPPFEINSGTGGIKVGVV